MKQLFSILNRAGWRPAIPVRAILLVVVEGQHDIAFLVRISRLLHAADATIPDLSLLEQEGRLIFVPAGGGDFRPWLCRLGPLGCSEFHLYDREAPPVTDERLRLAASVNARPRCQAVVTRKRSLENYLHPAAVQEARGLHLQFTDTEDVAELAASAVFASREPDVTWKTLTSRRPASPAQSSQVLAQHDGRRADDCYATGRTRPGRRGHWLAAHDRWPYRPVFLIPSSTLLEAIMSLSERLSEYVARALPACGSKPTNQTKRLREIAALGHRENWRLASWDIDAGLRIGGAKAGASNTAGADPLAAVRSLATMAEPEGTTLLVLVNFHRFLHMPRLFRLWPGRSSLASSSGRSPSSWPRSCKFRPNWKH